MAGEVTEPKTKAALAGGAATAAGATLAAGKIASTKKKYRSRQKKIKKETPAQRSRKLKAIAQRDRVFSDVQKSNENKMKQMRSAKLAADKELFKAAEKAEKRIAELRKIRDADMDKRQKMIKNAHISNQKAIIKGKAPKTALQIAKSIGLKSIPGVGAFISAISSSPAGEGSDRGLPNPEMNSGGLATKKYINPVKIVDNRKNK